MLFTVVYRYCLPCCLQCEAGLKEIKSYSYLAPEFLMGEDTVSPAVDLWAAGCILAEMITGQPLFKGMTTGS